MRIAIGAPGNGALLKDALAERLAEDGRVSDIVDLSTPDITYPEVSFQVARAVAEGRADRGLLICGTGVGTAIAANKVRGGCVRRLRTTCSSVVTSGFPATTTLVRCAGPRVPASTSFADGLASTANGASP